MTAVREVLMQRHFQIDRGSYQGEGEKGGSLGEEERHGRQVHVGIVTMPDRKQTLMST